MDAGEVLLTALLFCCRVFCFQGGICGCNLHFAAFEAQGFMSMRMHCAACSAGDLSPFKGGFPTIQSCLSGGPRVKHCTAWIQIKSCSLQGGGFESDLLIGSLVWSFALIASFL